VTEHLPPFQRFLDAHRDAVWRFLVASVGRAEAEDCFQETFLAALRAYPRLHPGSNMRAWALTIAHRKALDAHRGRARRPLPVAEMAGITGAAATRGQWAGASAGREAAGTLAQAGPEASAGADEALWDAVRALPARQRSTVVLRYVGDLCHREIAGALGCSEEAARRSLHEGLAKLRQAVAA
jgi:RNA polymerase sigma factor (sigma-70 family)